MKQTQIGWVFFIIIIPLVIFVTYMQPYDDKMRFLWGGAAIILLLFFKLTITVDESYVSYSFGIGLIRGKFLIADIEHCSPKMYVSLGWGIRYRPGVVMYNVSGNKAVELIIRGKTNKIWLGTKCPEELAEYINKVRDKGQ